MTFPCVDEAGVPHDGKANDQYLSTQDSRYRRQTADGCGISDNSGRLQQRNYPRQ